ncbi:MAG: hypothetical protein LLF76_00535 [Planctomycetaceae bacterium]|nr:hypothetical protein [Planctomycetaceae bacterium]
MVHIVWLVGILILAWGVTAVLKPGLIKNAVKFFNVGQRFLIAVFIRLLLAIVFLVCAFQTRHPRVILAFGVLFLVAGILLLVLPAQKRRSVLGWWAAKQVWAFQIIGIVVVLIGAVVIWAGRPL